MHRKSGSRVRKSSNRRDRASNRLAQSISSTVLEPVDDNCSVYEPAFTGISYACAGGKCTVKAKLDVICLCGTNLRSMEKAYPNWLLNQLSPALRV